MDSNGASNGKRGEAYPGAAECIAQMKADAAAVKAFLSMDPF